MIETAATERQEPLGDKRMTSTQRDQVIIAECEACGESMTEWRIGLDSRLLRCPACKHLKRDLSICNAKARHQDYSGCSRLDRIRLALTYRRLKGLLKGRSRLSVLEIGCSNGSLLAHFHRDGHLVRAIEPDPNGKLVRPLADAQILVQRCTAEQATLPSRTFDAIIALHVIEHLERPDKVFQKCQRALRDGGIAYFVTPCATSHSLTLFKENWWNLEDPGHVRFYSPSSIRKVLIRAGFSSVHARPLWWDGLRVEANSLARLFRAPVNEAMPARDRWIALLCAGLVPLTGIMRPLVPSIAPNLEIIAHR